MNHLHRRSTQHVPRPFKTTPILAALVLAGLATPVAAVDRTWDANNGLWTDAGNWSPIGVPGAGDHAIVTTGSPDLFGNATIDALTQSGGILGGTGTLTVTSTATLDGGTQSDAGTSQFDGGVNITGTGLRTLSGGRTMNTTATTDWSGNNASGQNSIRMNGSATINNSGTWNDANAFDSSIGLGSSGTKVFNNSGSYNKSGAGITDIWTAFNSDGATGAVDVGAGRLALNGGGTVGNTVAIASGTTLSVGRSNSSAGLLTFDQTSFSGTGRLLIEASGSSTVDALFSGAQSLAGEFAIANGTAQIADSLVVPTYTQTGGILGGTGTLTVTGTATLDGGTQSDAGTSQFDGGVNITGTGLRTLSGGRTMNTTATTDWSGNNASGQNSIRMNGSATINNSGTWNDANAFDSSIGLGSSGTKVFNNSGSYNKSGAGITDIWTAFNSDGATGAVDVGAGRLALNGGGTVGNTVAIASGTTLSVGRSNSSAGLLTFDQTSFSGTGRLLIEASGSSAVDALFSGAQSLAGEFAIANGTAQIADSLVVPTYTQTGGILGGTGTLTVTGTATLDGGTQSDAGTSQFDGGVNITGTGLRTLSGGRTMNTTATTDWSGNNASGQNSIRINGSATINNSGTWNDANAFDSSIGLGSSGTKVFNNSGSYNKSGAGITTISANYNNTGTTTIAAGTMAFNNAIDNTGGLIEGVGTLVTPRLGFDNAGTIAPGLGGAGALSVDGDLMLDPASVLSFDLASLTSFDELFLTGDITVGGTLEINSLGGYMPTINDSFQIITFADSINDQTFDTVLWNGFGGGVVLDVLYNPDNITLAVAAIPEPEQYLMMLAGLGLIGAIARRRRVQM